MTDSPTLNVEDDDINTTTTNDLLTVDPSSSMSIDDFQRKVLLAMEQEQQQMNPDYSLSQSTRIAHKDKEDSKYDEIKNVLGTSIITNLNDPKWEVKKQGFTAINEFILTQTPLMYNPSDLFSYIRYKLKDFKETNFNIVKEALLIFTTLASQKLLEKENCLAIINAYYEKLADIKLKEQLNAFILNALDSVLRADIFIKNILAKLAKKNNVKVTIEYSILFSRLVEEYEVDSLPVKEMVDMCKAMATNSNPQMRSSATHFLCVIYKWIGDDLRPLLKDIKESTLKIIEGELDKVEVVEHKENFLSKKETKHANNNHNNTTHNNTLLVDDNKCDGDVMNNESMNNDGLLPRVDVSKKITPNILKDIRDGKWQEKKEACEAIEKILADTGYKVLPVGLNEIFKLITTKLSDGNKNLVKMCIVLVGKFIRSLGDGFNKYIKQIALALLPNLSDKMPTVREECQNCLDVWVNYLGIESIVMFIPAFMKTNNFDLRTESFKFITRHANKLNKTIGESFFKELVDPLLLCMQDKTGSIRSSAEETIAYSTKFIDINLYYNALKDFKPVIESDLRESLNRLQNEYECNESNSNSNNYVNTCATPYVKKNVARTQRNNKSTRSAERTRKQHKQMSNIASSTSTTTLTTANHTHANTNVVKRNKRPPQLVNDDYLNKTCININNNRGTFAQTEASTSSFMKTPQKHLSSTSNTLLKPTKSQAIFKKVSSTMLNKYPRSSSTYQVFIPNINVRPPKERRIDNDKRSNFSIDTLNNDEHKLREQLKNLFTEDIIKRAFSNEFKNVVAVISLLRSLIEAQSEEMDIILDNLDLILKMICIKYNTNINPTMLKTFFEFLDALYQVIINIDYELTDTEVNIILPLLISKLTVNNTALKEHLYEILHSYMEFIGMGKATIVIVNASLNKNVKIKSEIIDIITELYLNNSIDIASKPYIKVFSRFLSVNDNVVKTKTVSLFREIYARVGDEIWQYIDITQKEKDFLERILFQDGDFLDDEVEFEYEGDDNDNAYEYKVNNNNSNSNKRTLKTNATVSHFNITNVNKYMKDEHKEKEKENYTSSNYKRNNIMHTNTNSNSNNRYHVSNSSSNNVTSAFSNSSSYNSANKVKKVTNNQRTQNYQMQSSNSNSNRAVNNKEQNSHHIMEQQISKTKITTTNNNTNSVNKHNTNQNTSLKTKNDLLNCLRNLLTEDLTEKVNAIIIIHEVLCPKYEDNKTLLTSNIDIIITHFVKATHSLFSVQNIADIPIKYAKYVATVLCKIATNKELISNISYSYLLELIEELLSVLLIDKLDKIGNNQEGNIIFKSLNSTMLRIMENCNGTNVIIALLEIIRKNRVNTQNIKLAGLAIKCILKVNQNLDNLIERLEFHRTLLQMHLLIIELQKTSSDLNMKSQIDQLIVKYIKNVIHEMVKKKTNAIIDEYNKGVRNHPVPDKFIIEWIQNYLDNINSQSDSNAKGKGVSNYQKSIVNSSQGNASGSGNKSSTSQHVGTTISELKKKWNEESKKNDSAKQK